MLDVSQIQSFEKCLANRNWGAVRPLFDYLDKAAVDNPMYTKYEESRNEWPKALIESRMSRFTGKIDTSGLTLEQIKSLIYSYFRTNADDDNIGATFGKIIKSYAFDQELLDYLEEILKDIVNASTTN